MGAVSKMSACEDSTKEWDPVQDYNLYISFTLVYYLVSVNANFFSQHFSTCCSRCDKLAIATTPIIYINQAP